MWDIRISLWKVFYFWHLNIKKSFQDKLLFMRGGEGREGDELDIENSGARL